MNIFIADDSDRVRGSLKNSLSDISSVRLVGEESEKSRVLESIIRCDPYFIILDLRLSGGTSFELIAKIKNARPHSIIAIFTDHSYELYRTKCLELGATYFFEKSMESGKLIQTIQQLAVASDRATTDNPFIDMK